MSKIIKHIFLLPLIISIGHYHHASAGSHGSHKINEPGEVNIYSARKAYLMKPLFQAFKKDTGITVNIISGKSKELQRELRKEIKRRTLKELLSNVDMLRQQDLKISEEVAACEQKLEKQKDLDKKQ